MSKIQSAFCTAILCSGVIFAMLLPVMLKRPVLEAATSAGLWEHIEAEHGVAGTYRMRVPGGWVVRYGRSSSAVTFVPDADHTWKVDD